MNSDSPQEKDSRKSKKITYTEFHGSSLFRLKIAYSLLLNRPIKITEIRSEDINPGLTKYEISFLKLISEITNGTEIHINSTGTGLTLIPGTITNNYGNEFEFSCEKSRGVVYYAEGLVPISLFGKESLHVKLRGITNNDVDNSVDSFRMSTCVLLQKLVVGDSVEFKVHKRGVLPNGLGEVSLKIPIITQLSPFDWKDEGRIKRVRGVAFTSKINSSFTAQMIDKAREILNNFLPDVWIAVDNYRSKDLNTISPGYGISLTAETKNGFAFSSDEINEPPESNKTAADISKKCTMKFLNEIYTAGCVNANNQGLFLFLMTLSEKNMVSYMKVGRVTSHTKEILRFVYKHMGVKFNIRKIDDYDKEESEEKEVKSESENEEERGESEEGEGSGYKESDFEIPVESEQYMFSCVGIGLKNVARIEL